MWVWGLVVANIFGLGVAHAQGWDVHLLLLLYWGQNVVIGIAAVFRAKLVREDVDAIGLHCSMHGAEVAVWQVVVARDRAD